MTDIWSFLLQTLEVSLAAVFLLILKKLLAPTLSPCWQYGFWGLLFLRLLIPAGSFGRYLFPEGAVFLQAIKETAESSLDSVFTSPFAPVLPCVGLPVPSGAPKSITDWLFVLYLVGVLFFLIRYLFSRLSLRFPLCKRHSASSESHIHTGRRLRFTDTAQSFLWTFFRCIHWCNPFLWYVFNRIEKDRIALRRHPKQELGTTLISACILAVLFFPLLFGISPVSISSKNSSADSSSALARAHLVRCTTLAGSADTFARGILARNTTWLTAASPSSSPEQLEKLLSSVHGAFLNGTYYIYNPEQTKPDTYSMLLVFPCRVLYQEDGSPLTAFSEASKQEQILGGTYVLPVTASKKPLFPGHSWMIKADGELFQVPDPKYGASCAYGSEPLPCWESEISGKTGTFCRTLQYIYTVQNPAKESSSVFQESSNGISTLPPDPDASFSSAFCNQTFFWKDTSGFSSSLPQKGSMVQMYVCFPEKDTEEAEFSSDRPTDLPSAATASSKFYLDESDLSSPDYDGILSAGGGSSFDWNAVSLSSENERCLIELSVNNVLKESVTFKEKGTLIWKTQPLI